MENQIIRALADDKTKKMFDKYTKKSESTDISRFLDEAIKLADIESCVTNYKKLNAEYLKLMNMVAPERWAHFSEYLIEDYFLENAEYKNDSFEKISNILHELNSEYVNGKAMIDIFQSMFENDKNEKGFGISKEEIEKIRNMPDDEFTKKTEIMKKKTPFRTSIKLYHGTSAANYEKILREGYLKPTDYSSINTRLDFINDYFKTETGYLFTSDSMDTPIALSFRGKRNNAFGKVEKSKYSGYGVVFEIDSTGYDLLLYKKDEILICGNVDIKDAVPHFFKMLWTGKIIETTYDDFVKDGIFE